MVRKYPKPVLCGDLAGASFYKEEYAFRLSLAEDCLVKRDTVELRFSASLNSNKLNELIKAGVAIAYYKIQTNRYSELFRFDIEDPVTHILEKGLLERVDSVKISAMVVANDDFELIDSDELIDLVKGYSFPYQKGDLLAISNVETLDYKLSGNPCVNMSLANQQENKGLAFSALDKQVIQIKVGPSLNNAYAKLKNDRNIKDVLNPFLAYTAILYALEKAILNGDDGFKEKDWYKIIDQSFESPSYDSLAEFIESMREDLDVDQVFEVVQQLLSNALEMKMREVARRL